MAESIASIICNKYLCLDGVYRLRVAKDHLWIINCELLLFLLPANNILIRVRSEP